MSTSPLFEAITYLIQLGGIAVLSLFGIYGTATVVLTGTISQAASQFVRVQRPPGFLENNEKGGACMLVGVHENCSTWYLYVGDRGVVDWLLNKSMIILPPSSRILSTWFKLAHLLQLLAMTFVAAQKGWDGIVMLILMVQVWILSLRFRDHRMANR